MNYQVMIKGVQSKPVSLESAVRMKDWLMRQKGVSPSEIKILPVCSSDIDVTLN